MGTFCISPFLRKMVKMQKPSKLATQSAFLPLFAQNGQTALKPRYIKEKCLFAKILKVRNADFAKSVKSVQAKGSKTKVYKGKVAKKV